MNKAINYIKSRKIGWWITTVLLIFIIILIAFPKLRMQFYEAIGLGLPKAKVEVVDNPPVLRVEAYDFSWRTMDDEQHIMSDYKGEVLFINFWATWCRPCIMEMGALEKLYKKYHKKVKFLLYSNQRKALIEESISKMDHDLPFVYTLYERPKEFDISVYPTTFIISKKGELILFHEGAADWDTPDVHALLDRLIKE